jgi:hypothetical protein
MAGQFQRRTPRGIAARPDRDPVTPPLQTKPADDLVPTRRPLIPSLAEALAARIPAAGQRGRDPATREPSAVRDRRLVGGCPVDEAHSSEVFRKKTRSKGLNPSECWISLLAHSFLNRACRTQGLPMSRVDQGPADVDGDVVVALLVVPRSSPAARAVCRGIRDSGSGPGEVGAADAKTQRPSPRRSR